MAHLKEGTIVVLTCGCTAKLTDSLNTDSEYDAAYCRLLKRCSNKCMFVKDVGQYRVDVLSYEVKSHDYGFSKELAILLGTGT